MTIKEKVELILMADTAVRCILEEDVLEIAKYDPNQEVLKIINSDDLEEYGIWIGGLQIKMEKKPDFALFEEKYGITIHPDLKELWSIFWCCGLTTEDYRKDYNTEDNYEENCEYDYEDDYEDDYMNCDIYLDLLDNPNLEYRMMTEEQLKDEVEEYDSEYFLKNVYFSIGQVDNHKLIFDNENGWILCLDHDYAEVCHFEDSIDGMLDRMLNIIGKRK